MGETRVQAATLVCKIFLRYLDQHPSAEGMLELWLKILDILDRMMNSGQGDSLVRSHHFRYAFVLENAHLTRTQEEAIPESIKNITLVMADQGHLVPPSQNPSKEIVWTETKKRLDRFLPDLFKEIFPEVPPPKETQQAPSAPTSPLPPTNATNPSENTPDEKENQAVVSETPKATGEDQKSD